MMVESIRVVSYLFDGMNLVRVDEFEGALADPDYIEGAISLDIDKVSLLTIDMVDLVDQLWVYLVNGLAAVSNGDSFQTFFPDQSIRIRMDRISEGRVTIDVAGTDRASATTNYDAFADALSVEASRFFLRMCEVVPSKCGAYEPSLRKLKAL